MHLVTAPLSVARLLWWYGEDDLWPSALQLAPHAVADIGERAVQIWQRRHEPGARPVNPKGDLALVLAALEFLEGRLRALQLEARSAWLTPSRSRSVRALRVETFGGFGRPLGLAI